MSILKKKLKRSLSRTIINCDQIYMIIDIESIKLIQKEVDYDKYSDF